MSAFLCSNSHISALAIYADREKLTNRDDASPEAIGAMLHAENVKSVNCRYSETTKPHFQFNRRIAIQTFTPVQIIKLAHCLGYQSCEHSAWKSSEACALLETIISHACYKLPGYEQAKWHLD